MAGIGRAMLRNILDRRVEPERWQRVIARTEPAYPAADPSGITASSFGPCNVEEAVSWAQRQPGALTLILQDAE